MDLERLPTYAEELGLDLRKKRHRFLWFLASLLFAKRISSSIAKRTFRVLAENGIDTPARIREAGWDRLVQLLDEGGYVRYDFSTATNLLDCAELLERKYNGDIDQVHVKARDPRDLEGRLMEFRGFGPAAVNIFLRELRGIWEKARPKPCGIALKTARRVGCKNVEDVESKLVRLALEFCKKKRCHECPVREKCRSPVNQ